MPSIAGRYDIVGYLPTTPPFEMVVVTDSSGMQLVIKRAKLDALDEEMRARVITAASTMQRLGNKVPNTVLFLESFEDDGYACAVLEYCEVGTLAYILASAGEPDADGDRQAFSEVEVLQWFVQVATALAGMHEQRVLHLNVNAGTVYLTSDGIAKLGDFELSCALPEVCHYRHLQAGPCSFDPLHLR